MSGEAGRIAELLLLKWAVEMGVQWVLVCHGLITLLVVVSFLCGRWPIFDGTFIHRIHVFLTFGAYDYFCIYEALELRDGGSDYLGKGVSKAIANLNSIIGPALIGKISMSGMMENFTACYSMLKLLVENFLQVSNPKKLTQLAINVVYDSWDSPRANKYRSINQITGHQKTWTP